MTASSPQHCEADAIFVYRSVNICHLDLFFFIIVYGSLGCLLSRPCLLGRLPCGGGGVGGHCSRPGCVCLCGGVCFYSWTTHIYSTWYDPHTQWDDLRIHWHDPHTQWHMYKRPSYTVGQPMYTMGRPIDTVARPTYTVARPTATVARPAPPTVLVELVNKPLKLLFMFTYTLVVTFTRTLSCSPREPFVLRCDLYEFYDTTRSVRLRAL